MSIFVRTITPDLFFHGRRRTYFLTTLHTVLKKCYISCQMRRRWVMDWPKTLFSHTDIGPTRFETSENVSYKKINFGFGFIYIVQIIFSLFSVYMYFWSDNGSSNKKYLLVFFSCHICANRDCCSFTRYEKWYQSSKNIVNQTFIIFIINYMNFLKGKDGIIP